MKWWTASSIIICKNIICGILAARGDHDIVIVCSFEIHCQGNVFKYTGVITIIQGLSKWMFWETPWRMSRPPPLNNVFQQNSVFHITIQILHSQKMVLQQFLSKGGFHIIRTLQFLLINSYPKYHRIITDILQLKKENICLF